MCLSALALVLCCPSSGRLGAQQRTLTFDGAVRGALERHERALAAGERIDAADARVMRARAAFLPSLSFAGTYTRRAFETVRQVGGDEITIQSLNAFSAAANASLTLLDPRLFPLYSQVKSDRDASQAEAWNAARLVAYDAAAAYLDAIAAEQLLQAAERRLELARINLDAARARYSAQLAGINDVTRGELEYATAQRERTTARGARETARLRLGYSINSAPPDSLAPPDDILMIAGSYMAVTERLVELALRLRADITISRARADALRASATEAVMRALPNVTAVAQYRWTNEAGFSGKNTNWYVGANLAWTLFDGGAWLADRAERAGMADAADLESRAIERQIDVDIRAALVALTNARAARDQADVALDAARKNADETRELYRQGLVSALASADANVRLFESDVAHTQARIGLVSAFLALRAAIGFDPLGNDLTRRSAE